MITEPKQKPAKAAKPAQAVTKEPPNSSEVVALFLVNLRAIRDWYRLASPGSELGHNRILEIACNVAVIALEHAILGKTWQPPT